MSEERKHHPFSPSKLQYLEACPCYESRESKHARTIAGTKAHKVSETGIDDKELEDDDAVAVAECLDFYEKRRQLMEQERHTALKGKVFIPEQIPQNLELKETQVAIDDEDTTSGYFDRALVSWDRKRAELFDWKFGMWPIEPADNNLQGMAYALGIFRMFPTVDRIEFFFFQPLLVPAMSSVVFTRADIPRLYLRVCTVVARAKEARRLNDFSTANPMVPVCNFCANIGRCPKVAAFACKVGNKFYPVQIPESITPTMVQSPTDVSIGLKLAAIVKIWAESFRAVATDRVLRGEAPVPDGYKVEGRQGSREVKNFKAFKQFALQYMTESEFEDACSVSLGAVEKAVNDKAPRGGKKSAVEAFKNLLEEQKITERGNSYSFLKVVQ